MALYNLLLLILFSPPIICTQIPLQRHSPPSDLNPSFIFTSLHGILRQAPNTFSPNGFSILPGTVPAYTNLYHARKDSGDIPKIEWVAFDAEMSYGIMGGRGGETWLHTYVTTRDVRVLVFDGMSAALGGSGTMDSQSVFLYGEVKNETRRRGRQGGLVDEYTRAADLCKWAEKLGGGGIEGFVRMNTGFEMVWCDFEKSESWRLVSKLNVTAPDTQEQQREDVLDDEGPRPPPGRPGHGYGPPGRGYGYGPPGGMPWSNAAGWEWIRSATWHYSLSPESRVTPDFCCFFTFYSPSFKSFPNTLTTRKNSSHRLIGVLKPDATAFKTAIGESLLPKKAPCSGLDWRRVTQDIMDRYGGRIKELSLVLSANATNATEKVEKAGKLAFAGVMPFVNNSLPTGEEEERCTHAFTEFIPEASLSPQEFLLRDTVEAVLGRICRLFVDVYFEYVQPQLSVEDTVWKWRRNTETLMGWLDWDMWRMCEERCRWDEVCAMALWPVLGLVDSEEWSKPRCINSSTIERRGRRSGPPPRGEGPEPDMWTVLEL